MFIYGLKLKTSVEYRYVGITSKSSVRQRFVAHMSHSRGPRKQHPVNIWIRENDYEDGVCIDILEEISPEEGIEYLEESEKMWIHSLRYLGYDLLNVSTGGRLPNGYKHSEEQKRKWSVSRKGSITGSKNPNYGKTGASNHMYGRVVSKETRKKASDAKIGHLNPNFGVSPSADRRAKQSAALKGRSMPSSRKSAHTRWHTNKGISRPETCNYCKELINV